MSWFDLVLVVGATLRLNRLVIVDDLTWMLVWERLPEARTRKMERWRDGLFCPFCIGFWIGFGVVLSWLAWGNRLWWMVIAGALTLNYLTAHVVKRLDME